jgi:energy-coupling factor transporter ATP-binding protein EcfA2
MPVLEKVQLTSFRGFKDLTLDGLGRVNLIVGKNNAGKTSLLEALYALMVPDQIGALPTLFRAPAGSYQTHVYPWFIKDGAEEGIATLTAGSKSGEWKVVFIRSNDDVRPSDPSLGVVFNDATMRAWGPPKESVKPMRVRTLSVQQRIPRDLISAFAEGTRARGGEAILEELLRTVDSRLNTVRMDVDNAQGQQQPHLVADLGLSERMPLAQAGEGVNRLVSLFSQLFGGRPQAFLADEIENGIHYTALPHLWAAIAKIATSRNMQVFATTHSRECFVAAHEAFSKSSSYDLRVIQLYRIEDRNEGRVLDRKHIEAAVAGDIEIR